MKKPKYLIIMPTFNEADNVQKIIPAIFDIVDNNVDILIVDDNSPDGTSDIIANMQSIYPRLELMTKTKDKGFAKAYISGFNYAIDNAYDYVIQMDADGSHQPKFLKELITASGGDKYVIGSRWVKGGSVVNWPFNRKLLSLGGNLYSRIMLHSKVKDITGGFKIIPVSILQSMGINEIKVKGYSFQIELMLRARKSGASIVEVPIEFIEREYGVSKMSSSIVKEALIYVTRKGLGLK